MYDELLEDEWEEIALQLEKTIPPHPLLGEE